MFCYAKTPCSTLPVQLRGKVLSHLFRLSDLSHIAVNEIIKIEDTYLTFDKIPCFIFDHNSFIVKISTRLTGISFVNNTDKVIIHKHKHQAAAQGDH